MIRSPKPGRKVGVAMNNPTGINCNLRYESIAEIDNENVSIYPEEEKNLTDQDMEIRFNGISLSIRTEALTLTHRLEYQRRQRDLCEANLHNEIEQLGDLLQALQQEVARCLVHNYNSRGMNCEGGSHFYEKFSSARNQLKILKSTALRISSISENLGAVEHESRLSSAVELMIQYVDNVKRKWEKEHRELEETKRILQESGLNIDECFGSQESKDVNFNNNNNVSTTKRRVSLPAAPFRKFSLMSNVVKKIQTTFISEEIPAIPPIGREEEKTNVKEITTEVKSVKNNVKVDEWTTSAICNRNKGYVKWRNSSRRKSSANLRKATLFRQFQAYIIGVVNTIWQRWSGITLHYNNGSHRLRSRASNDLKWDIRSLLHAIRYFLACVFLFAAFVSLVITFTPSISKSIASRMLPYNL